MMNKRIIAAAFWIAGLLMVFLGGGASLSYSSSGGFSQVQASCTPTALVAFFVFLFLYVWPLTSEVDVSKQAVPLSIRRRLGSFMLDFVVVVSLVAVPGSFAVLLIESAHTGQFEWQMSRLTSAPTDSAILIVLWISIAVFLLLFALPVGLQRQSPGGLVSNSFIQTKHPSILRALGRSLLSFIVLSCGVISIPTAWCRKDRRFWHDLAFATEPVQLTGRAKK